MDNQKKEITYRVHWLSFTVHGSSKEAFTLYNTLFRDLFGDLEDTGHGGRRFKTLLRGLLEFKVYMNPNINTDDYFNFEIPGQACDLMNPEYFQALEDLLNSNYENKYQYKRLDFAFDNVPFLPEEVESAIAEEKIRSLATRESLEIHKSPFKKRDNGEIGTYTVEFGSPNSQRMITVYNKRGPTRIEFQMKDERAHRIACELFQAYDIQSWYQIMIGHLRDYIDIFTPWWDEFTKSLGRAYITVSNPKDVSMEKMLEWFDFQIAPAFSAIVDTQNPEVINGMINRGRYRRSARYNLLVGHDDNG